MAGAASRRHIVLAVLAGLALTGCAGGEESTTPTTDEAATTVTTTETTVTEASDWTGDPEDLLPQLADLPPGYTINQAESQSRFMSDEADHVMGYEVTFESPKLHIMCSVDIYASDESAEQAARLGAARLESALDSGEMEGGETSLEEEVGDEAWAYNIEAEGFSAFLVLWHYRDVESSCMSAAPLGKADPDLTVRIAQAQQRRIATALG